MSAREDLAGAFFAVDAVATGLWPVGFCQHLEMKRPAGPWLQNLRANECRRVARTDAAAPA